MGRNLSGQTIEAFYNSLQHFKPFCVGLNCAWGATDMRPYLGTDLVTIIRVYDFYYSFIYGIYINVAFDIFYGL